MVCNTPDYWVFGLCPTSGILKDTTIQKLDLFQTSYKKMRDIYCTSVALYPQEDFWYLFLLEAESTPGPQCGWKD
jgi:hypothetical protein